MSWSFSLKGPKEKVTASIRKVPEDNDHVRFAKGLASQFIESAPLNMEFEISAQGHFDHSNEDRKYSGSIEFKATYALPKPKEVQKPNGPNGPVPVPNLPLKGA